MSLSVEKLDLSVARESRAADLPKWQELQIHSLLPCSSASLALWKAYHQIPKRFPAYVKERIQHLRALAADWSHEDWGKLYTSWQLWLSEQALGKAAYLQRLWELAELGFWDEAVLQQYHHSCTPPDSLVPLTLTREFYRAPDQKGYWGGYWMKSLDPNHRYMPELLQTWEGLNKKEKMESPFLLWLDAYWPSGEAPSFLYLTQEEQEKIQLIVDGQGRLCKAHGRPLHIAERQAFLFVIDEHLRLLGSLASPELCHASLSRGRPVYASGLLRAQEGKIVSLKFASGHYISGPQHWQQALVLLQQRGLHLHDPLRLTVFSQGRFLSQSVSLQSLSRWPRDG